jgi:hypothetical protein
VKRLSFNSAVLTLCELVVCGALIYGFSKEQQIIDWEQRQIKRIKKTIYNFIVKIENKI